MWEASISHDPVLGPLFLGTTHLNMGEKESIMSQSMQDSSQ